MPGYLTLRELPNSLALLPPPPEAGSAAYELDMATSRAYLEQTDSARWEQARTDAILYFPEAMDAFSGILDVQVSEETTPNLIMLLRRAMSDAALSTYTAKKHYMRILRNLNLFWDQDFPIL